MYIFVFVCVYVCVTADSSRDQWISDITGCLSYCSPRTWPWWSNSDSLSGI